MQLRLLNPLALIESCIGTWSDWNLANEDYASPAVKLRTKNNLNLSLQGQCNLIEIAGERALRVNH